MRYGVKIVEKTLCGERVFVKTLTGGAHAAKAIELLQKVGANPSIMAELGGVLMCCCLVNESGVPEFESPDEARDSASLGFIKQFVEAVLEISGLDEEADEILKNSEAVR